MRPKGSTSLSALQDYSAGMERCFRPAAAVCDKIKVAQWRDDGSGPMRVVSGTYGREKVHYEAPAADRLDNEMQDFLTWFNLEDKLDPVVKAALAHLWFVTIHPFDDGNGRIARAIADMSLARSEASPQRFYSMSAQIQLERQAYYEMLETTQKGDLDITRWLEWFLSVPGSRIRRRRSDLVERLPQSRVLESKCRDVAQ